MKYLECITKGKTEGSLSKSQRTGIIKLLEKKGKSRLELSNWRPITLLNFDYKLISKVIATRIKRYLPNLIKDDQNGFVPGGNIFFSLRTIRDILFHCKAENLELFMIAIDYSKAFDSVDHSTVFKVFETFNFGENLINWVRTLYKDGRSCIMNNDFKSDYFPIERSCRQGDPLSPYCFVLTMQLLLNVIRSDENIHGVNINPIQPDVWDHGRDLTGGKSYPPYKQ